MKYLLLLFLHLTADAWLPSNSIRGTSRKRTVDKTYTNLSVAPTSGEESSSDNQSLKEEIWGVSYIGGDPCSSKYNDDPFDASKRIEKPGLPDDMKARIDALVEKIKLEENKQNDS
mmetsp:Transcript_32797/g.37964  ORF Transcript_32797/g.37964 Transcript_32797/m.37964 type:complete len:116 (-) Transcript_32797:9-356(-)